MGPLSEDLRKRVVWAVGEEGMSCRAAARRFGVSFASAIRWVAALRDRGSYAPLPMGGDTRSQRVEAHADYLLRLHRREPDLTLNEIRARLERARGEKVSASMIWRFFDRHDITHKKVGARERAGPPGRPWTATAMVRGSTRPRSAETGVRGRDGGDDQHGAPLRAAAARATSALRRSARPLQSDHLRLRPASERRRRAQGL